MKNLFCFALLGALTLGALSSCKKDEPEPESVTIDGVEWATRNLGASRPEDYGDLFPEFIEGICPAGWRLPTCAEFESLMAADRGWTTLNGVKGRRFGNKTRSIFLPAAGYRGINYWFDFQMYDQGTGGVYLSSDQFPVATGISYIYLIINDSKARIYRKDPHRIDFFGCSARCVKEPFDPA
jgi:uncharacterized protein (TIGR02145 family)